MCGIAGVVVWDDRFRVERDALAQMSARLAHRGPDAQGTFLNHSAEISGDRPQVGLVHRRLAILDLDPRANQPMSDAAGHTLIFNGEIYNFRDLRKELANYPWRTESDTEVILAAYDAWGMDCVRKFEGMFAFAIWDQPQRTLFLARDRMGQKPLYIATPAAIEGTGDRPLFGAIAFASEVQALAPLGWTRQGISQGGLAEYLAWGHTSFARSIYKGITQLTPGSMAVASEKKLSADVCYWPEEGFPDGRKRPAVCDEQAISKTRDLLRGAVRRQLVSDVPIGCFLSGGVDSSVVAAAMQGTLPVGQKALTFSIGFEDPRYDESEFAAKVAAHLGTEHHKFTVHADAAADLPKIAAAFGEPFGDSSALPTFYLSRETRQHVKVALSGDGGDELFCGYDRYRAMRLARRLRRALTPAPFALASLLSALLPGGHPKSTVQRAQRFLQSLGKSDRQRYSDYLRLFDTRWLPRLFRERVPAEVIRSDRVAELFGYPHWNQLIGAAPLSDPLVAAMASDRMLYLPDDLLTKVDRCSMAFALEVRSPFMDHQLVEFAAALTPRQLLAGGSKRMLRQAFAQDLPSWVFQRQKMGFAVPIGDWFRGELREMLHDYLFAKDSFAAEHFAPWVIERIISEHMNGRRDHSQRLYALLMLELWWRSNPR